MSIINGIDYDNLAEMAETSRVSFETLCKRAERGLPLAHTEEQSPDWVGYQEAAKILRTSYGHLAGVFTSKEMELEYWGIKWKTRSLVKPQGKRGCGVLFYKPDLIVVANIKKYTHMSIMNALRVYQAMEGGHI